MDLCKYGSYNMYNIQYSSIQIELTYQIEYPLHYYYFNKGSKQFCENYGGSSVIPMGAGNAK